MVSKAMSQKIKVIQISFSFSHVTFYAKSTKQTSFNCIQEERKKSDTSEAVSELPFPFHVDPASQESLKQLDEYFETRSYVQVFDQVSSNIYQKWIGAPRGGCLEGERPEETVPSNLLISSGGINFVTPTTNFCCHLVDLFEHISKNFKNILSFKYFSLLMMLSAKKWLVSCFLKISVLLNFVTKLIF
jgi:hypothetical protein